jgi:uncharacterized protein (UPF0216 family)
MARRTITQLIREAISAYKLHEGSAKRPRRTMAELLKLTKGTWKLGDGLKYQLKIRFEWDGR